jgi:poly-gamma-glutamate capsule biosynthesis protein CapA/YwtB (metallophosphatase superfamily)
MMRALVTLFFCGDLMTGRGIDQILPVSNPPQLFEPYVKDARTYVTLAENRNGPIPEGVDYRYIWGDALDILSEIQPAARIVNLETSITQSEDFWPRKGIHYRMHPANVELLKVAAIDCCVLSNNHTADLGFRGLLETLDTLRLAGIKSAGAGSTATEAASPAILEVIPDTRVLVFGYGMDSAGVPASWAAGATTTGVNFLPDLSPQDAEAAIESIKRQSRPEDIVIFSVHWGSNWGYDVPDEQIEFARRLIDSGAVDIVHGHSSHHFRPLEIYKGKLIVYGAGDFLNDYEGIEGYESYRDDLALMYFPTVDARTGQLVRLRMVPLQMFRFSLRRASAADAAWLSETLTRVSRQFGTRVKYENGGLELELAASPGEAVPGSRAGSAPHRARLGGSAAGEDMSKGPQTE